jgi:hypothetical protein
MLYLDFVHIDDFGAHLKDKGVMRAFVTTDSETAASVGFKSHKATFSARVDDYIALCTFGFHSKEELSLEQEFAYVKEQSEMLTERLSRFGIPVKEGRWTDETPQGLKSEMC